MSCPFSSLTTDSPPEELEPNGSRVECGMLVGMSTIELRMPNFESSFAAAATATACACAWAAAAAAAAAGEEIDMFKRSGSLHTEEVSGVTTRAIWEVKVELINSNECYKIPYVFNHNS
jgi:hypothetical protein